MFLLTIVKIITFKGSDPCQQGSDPLKLPFVLFQCILTAKSPMIDMSSYLPLYKKTATELITVFIENLKKYRSNLNDKNILFELKRGAHSLKSQSLIMGFNNIGDTFKAIEQYFNAINEKNTTPLKAHLEEVHRVTKEIKKNIESEKISRSAEFVIKL